MKKIISVMLAIATILCMFALPCQAVELDFIVNTDVDAEENLITIYGTLPTQFGAKKDITYYLLYPENTIDDIPQNPDAVANYGQFKSASSGEFSHTIKVSEGVFTLFAFSQTSKLNPLRLIP